MAAGLHNGVGDVGNLPLPPCSGRLLHSRRGVQNYSEMLWLFRKYNFVVVEVANVSGKAGASLARLAFTAAT